MFYSLQYMEKNMDGCSSCRFTLFGVVLLGAHKQAK